MRKIVPPARPSLLAPLLVLLAPALAPLAPRLDAQPQPAVEVSRTPPPLYTEKIEPLLTPLDNAIKLIPEIDARDSNGIVLINETFCHVDEQCRRFLVVHTAYKCLVEAGAKTISSDTFTYRKHDQKFTLVLAETIQPDGAVLPVKPNAVILQTPQRQADSALYDDLAEVRVIYPSVKPGSITRAITIIEDLRARMPGEYSQRVAWGAGWPVAISRTIADLPDSLAQRIRLFPIGPGVPSRAIEKFPAKTADAGAGARVRHIWSNTLQPALRYEPSRAPAWQTGPSSTLTSIAAWDDIARWFSGLVRGRDTLSPALAEKVNDWTCGLDADDPAKPADRDAIIRILFAKVASDVRYVGLEFGDSDYQPHDCNEVWENQYGDCKDKSNLLRAFLRHKNIPAHVALLNTSHLGLIDRRAPNYRVFDHAIVAIPDARADAGFLFCDPTITHAEPGTLHNGDTDRDALVIAGDNAIWARTPRQNGRRLAYDFDLQLAPAGEISGWLTVTAEGYLASAWRGWSRRYDTDGLRRSFQQQVRDFYDGASVIDVSVEPADTASGPCVAKTYFTVPGQESAVRSLSFPIDNDLLPGTGNSAQRETAFPLVQGRTVVTATIKLPPGAAPARQGEPYHVSTPSFTAAASWDYSPLTQTCRAHLDIDITQPSVSAAEFGRFHQAVQSLRAWLQQPLVLATSTAPPQPAAARDNAAPSPDNTATPHPPAPRDNAPAPRDNTALPALDFPMMPTGSGQLELADTRYPVNGNRALARAALEKTIQYFPGDKPTVFDATVHLARLDWYADKNQEALDRITPLLAAYKNDVTSNSLAWAEYIQALILRDLKRETEAIAILERLALDTQLPVSRRAYAAMQFHEIAGHNDPARAMAALDAVSGLRSENENDILAAIAHLSLRQNDGDAPLRARLETLLQTRPADAQDMLAAVINLSKNWTAPDDSASQSSASQSSASQSSALQSRLVEIIGSLVPAPAAGLAGALKDMRARISENTLALEIQSLLKKSLSEPPCSKHYKPAPDDDDALKTAADYERAIEAAEGKKDAARTSMLLLHGLVNLPADDTFAKRLTKAILHLEWKDRVAGSKTDDPLFELVCELAERCPRDSNPNLEARFQRAKYLLRREKFDEVQSIYEDLARSPETPASFHPAAFAGLARSLERKGDFTGALDACKQIESHASDSYRAADALLRAVFINLHEDRPAEALRIIKILGDCPDETLTDAEGGRNIREFITLARSGQAREFWAARAKWWPQWLAFEKKYAPEPAPAGDTRLVVPLITDAENLLSWIGKNSNAARKKDIGGAFQKIAAAARWLPSAGADFAYISNDIAKVFPAATADHTRLCIAMLGVPVSEENHLRERLFQLAVKLRVVKRHDACLDTIARFKAIKHEPADWRSFNINRIWAMSALESKKQMREAAAAITADLANPDSSKGNSRDFFVNDLANLYRALGDTEAEAALLQREMNHPWFKADKDKLDELKKRAAQLDTGRQFAAQIAAWLRDNPIPWYDHAEPRDLDDPRLRNLDDAIRKAASTFTAPEAAKLHFLVAQSTGVARERQRSSMENAIANLTTPISSLSKIRAIYDSIIHRDGLDDDLRLHILVSSLWSYFYIDSKDDFYRNYELLCAKEPAPEIKKRADILKTGIEADRLSADSLASTIRKFAEDEIDNIKHLAIAVSYNALLQLGATDTAQAITTEIPQWRYAADASQTTTTVAFDFTRALRAIESYQPVHEALIRVIDQHIKDAPTAPPPGFDDLCRAGIPKDAGHAEQRAFCLWAIKQRKFDRTSFNIWKTLMRSFSFSPDDEKITPEMAREAIQAAPDDHTRGLAILTMSESLDLDQPWIYDAFIAALEPHRDPAGNPLTYDYICAIETEVNMRVVGGGADPQVSLATATGPICSFMRLPLSLQHNLQRKDKAALKVLVAKGNSSQLLTKLSLPYAIPAFDLLEMKTEAGMARDVARREVRLGILMAWAGSPDNLGTTLELIKTLDDPALMPAAFLDTLDTIIRDPFMRTMVRLTQARAQKDWPAVLENAEKLIALQPTMYKIYWDKADALWKLGRQAEARPALETFTRHAKDAIEHPEAMRMLGEP